MAKVEYTPDQVAAVLTDFFEYLNTSDDSLWIGMQRFLRSDIAVEALGQWHFHTGMEEALRLILGFLDWRSTHQQLPT